MKDLNTHLGPGQASSTSEKGKPGEPGFKNENTEAHSTRFPRYKPAAQLLALLREQHTVFRDYLPLAIGIHQPIGTAYPEFGKTAIRRALQFHTMSRAYLKNLAAGGHRYDLVGQPWGRTPEHQRRAQEQLKNPRAKPAGPPSQKAALPYSAAEEAAPVVLNTQALNWPRLRA